MTNTVLDEIAREEIRTAMTGLRNKQASAEAARLAQTYGVSINTIYNATNDLRPKRKTRADKGTTQLDMLEDEGLRHAAELVADLHLSPYRALQNAKDNGMCVNTSEATFRRYLNKHGIGRLQRVKTKELYTRFEAEAPGELFHYDDTGAKLRVMLDLKSRKIMRVPASEVNYNHPNMNPNRVQVWALAVGDDFSRRRFIRYVAANHLSSANIATFLLEAFREMGVPLTLYCDNAKPLRSKRMERAAQLLDKAFESSGGFRLLHHAPLNSKASGKVEIAHKWTEECFRLFAINGDEPTLDGLNFFAANMCAEFNERVNRATGEMPIARWQRVNSVFRVAPPATLDAAFLAREFTVNLRADLTIKIEGETLQLPRENKDNAKLLDWAALGHKVTVILPHQADWLVVIGQDGTEVICDHLPFKAHKVGEFQAMPATSAEQLRKELKASRKAKLAEKKESGERFNVRLVDQPSVIHPAILFPKTTVEISAEKIAAIPGASALAGKSGARVLDYFDAIDWLRENKAFEDAPDAASIGWLKAIFGAREQVEEHELQAAWDTRPSEQSNVIPMHKLKLA